MTRFGIGWRPELAAGILAHLDRIDVVEVMIEDYVNASRKEKEALRFLRTVVPVVAHATSLGLAGGERVDANKLDAVARVVGWLEPELWSEHLAFVRAGRLEIGHLAAPPRNEQTLVRLRRNIEEARSVVGSAPLVENVASLIEPPLSSFTEQEWLRVVPAATGCQLLLDLHNLHANATNFGFDAASVVRDLPQIGAIHLAGGRRIEGDRVLDDHLHDVPDPVYELLGCVAAVDPTVILERDGNYPPIETLLAEIDRARSAWNQQPEPTPVPAAVERGVDSSGHVFTFLARLYADDEARLRFAADPVGSALSAGLNTDEARGFAAVDLENLSLAARSFSKKRASRVEAERSPWRP